MATTSDESIVENSREPSLEVLLARVRELESRVTTLEAERARSDRHPAAATGSPGSTPTTGHAAGPGLPHPARVIQPAVAGTGGRGDFETLLGLTWFNRVGAALLVVGFILAAIWANDRGYLSPLLRNALAGLAALGIFAAGVRLSSSRAAGRQRFGIGVALLGVCGLYAVPITASRIDAILSPAAATALLIAVTVTVAALALRHRSAALTLFGLLGGLALPVLILGGSWNIAHIAAIVLPVTAVFLAIQRAIGAQRIELAASLGLSAYFLAWLWMDARTGWTAITVGLALWLANLAYARLLERREQSYRAFDGAVILAGAAAAFVTLAQNLDLAHLRAALILVPFALQTWLWRRRPHALLLLLALAGSPLLLLIDSHLAWSVALFDLTVQALLITGVAVAMLLAYHARSRETRPDQDHDTVATTASALNAVGWILIGHESGTMTFAALFIALNAGFWLLTDVVVRRGDAGERGHDWAQVMTVIMLVIAVITALWPVALGPRTLWLSAVVVIGALALLAIGVRTGYPLARVLGLGSLACALIKIVAIDLWNLAAGYRIATIVVLGLGLLCASFFYSRYTDRGDGHDATGRDHSMTPDGDPA